MANAGTVTVDFAAAGERIQHLWLFYLVGQNSTAVEISSLSRLFPSGHITNIR